ncbi:Nn.00g118140.m01.CDS01 [Neocucurbitaria sp. VM-36]
MSAYWLNNSCSPFEDVSATCSLGNMAPYAINVQVWTDIAAGFEFAKQKNIRVTVKNTGHDYLGRSAGEGSLALWMHNLNDTSWFNYSSSAYRGHALKTAAGVQFAQVYHEASERGLRVVGGLCSSVGIAGGYVQGGGHGPLSSTYGLAADNVLEYEAVTTQGQLVVASPQENQDLFWALSGGGAGNYGVVLSMTTKAHPDGIVAGASLTLNVPAAGSQVFWSAVTKWHRHVLALNQIPGFSANWGVTAGQFVIRQAALVDGDTSAMAELLGPFLHELDSLNLTYSYEMTDHRGFYEYYQYYNAAAYPTNATVGSQLIQRSMMEDETQLQNLIAVVRSITSTTWVAVEVNGQAANVSHARAGNLPGSNAVLPAWRDSSFHMIIAVSFDAAALDDELQRIQAQLNEWQDQVKAIAPSGDGGAYMNEATYDNPDWKRDYYGANYDALLTIKEKYDPGFALWSRPSVGSDVVWTVAQDGRLCTNANGSAIVG